METAISIVIEHAGVIGVALVCLAVYGWHRWLGWSVRMEYADVEAERQAEHARRASELKQAAKWQQERDERVFRVIKGRKVS